jgi:hypothetical protein
LGWAYVAGLPDMDTFVQLTSATQPKKLKYSRLYGKQPQKVHLNVADVYEMQKAGLNVTCTYNVRQYSGKDGIN